MMPEEWRTWVWWVLACAVGWSVGGTVGEIVGSSINMKMAVYVGMAGGGVVAGIFQWLVLQQKVRQAVWWVIASIGAVVVINVVFITVDLDGAFLAFGGTILGVFQWLVLRRLVAQSGLWVLASGVGWVVGGFLSGAFEGGVLGWTTIGILYGVITGFVLVRLLRSIVPH